MDTDWTGASLAIFGVCLMVIFKIALSAIKYTSQTGLPSKQITFLSSQQKITAEFFRFCGCKFATKRCQRKPKSARSPSNFKSISRKTTKICRCICKNWHQRCWTTVIYTSRHECEASKWIKKQFFQLLTENFLSKNSMTDWFLTSTKETPFISQFVFEITRNKPLQKKVVQGLILSLKAWNW